MKIVDLFLQFANMRLLRRRNPTCKFYGNVCVENSQLGKSNTLFLNVYICNSSIGDFTYIQRNTNVINTQIGKFCSIASGARIGLGTHPINNVSMHSAFYSVSQPLAKTFAEKDHGSCFKKTFIGHDVWIGENALIKDGVNIGTGAVVGAGAVVTHDVPNYAVVAGVPAKIIKYRFDEVIRNRLGDSKWWDLSEDWLIKHCGLFLDPQNLLKALDDENKKN